MSRYLDRYKQRASRPLRNAPLVRHPQQPRPIMHASELPFSAPKKARIEIIPLIDVIFFLLATFVLFTLSLEKIKAIEVPLPVPPPPPHTIQKTLFIQASDGGTFFWQEGEHATPEPIAGEELQARLADYKDRTPVPRVMIRGDRKAKFGAAVWAMDQVRLAKITEVSIETRPAQ